ncbi:hypothetical protein SSX86_010093 [Deinandra increscens subsp. villosa]|uniref:TF-B3 domain-containing protein n=1 Tax=Deinandra increscens subsp. villosa TaxID=3103831 RepID=A0AAP0DAU2_9ASTR
MCNGCAPPDTALVASTQETTPTFVDNNQIIDIEHLHESNGSTSTTKARAQVPAAPNEKPDHPGKSRKHEGYRYTPRMTAEELGKIFKGSNAEVIPLFEKMLTASDMGRTGRLVLPKKCAEEFFPTIDDAQAYPIKIQDTQGKLWKFNLRTWPNSNSRMYVLEGFEPYGKSMGLSEGDTVTFCRLVPEGKLVIGNRKAPSPPSQDKVTTTTNKEVSNGKRISTKRKRNVVRNEQSGLVIVEGGVGSKRKTCETGVTGKGTNKKNKRLAIEDSPRGSRRYKHASKRKTKSTTGSSKMVISSTEPAVENTDPGPFEPVETEVTEMENAVTLPVPLNWVKKGPRHRSRCQCATCVGLRLRDEGSPSASQVEPGSSDALQLEPGSSDELQVEPGSSNALQVEPGSSDALQVEPGSSNALQVEPGSSDALQVEPGSSDALQVEPGSSDALQVEPGRSNALQVEPGSSDALLVEPGSSDALQVEPGSSDALRVEPESSNGNGQTTGSSSSGGSLNINNMPGSDAKVLPFDLNLQPESDEEYFMDTMNRVEETSSGSKK